MFIGTKTEAFAIRNEREMQSMLKQAMAEELAAQNSYQSMLGALHSADFPISKKKEIIDRIIEIADDEEQHFGSLHAIMKMIDQGYENNIKAGEKGK
jgi:rubrerythrin